MNPGKILFLSFTILLSGCNNENKTAQPDLGSDTSFLGLRIYEDSLNNIFMNGTSISLTDIEAKFVDLKRKGGMVSYSCKGATEQPPEDSKVIDLIKKYCLPVKMYTDSTFTNSFY